MPPSALAFSRHPVAAVVVPALAFAVARALASAAPGAPAAAPGAAAALVLGFGFLFAAKADDATWHGALAPALAALLALAFVIFTPLPPPSQRLLVGYASLITLLVALWPLARSGWTRLRGAPWSIQAVGLAGFAVVAAEVAWRVAVARPFMFSDYMICRLVAIQVAGALQGGAGFALVSGFVRAMTLEYSLLPSLGPGLVLALGDPLSRPLFLAVVVTLYAAPAYLALGLWARALARAAGVAAEGPGPLALGLGLVFAAAPGALALVSLGMPDLGGVAIGVLALASGRLLIAELSRGAPERAAPVGRGVEFVALLFLMFVFRRWYLFAAVGVAAAVAIEAALLAASGRLRWRESLAAAGAMGLVALGLAAPIALDWLPDLKSHDYAAIYAGYHSELGDIVVETGEAYGFAVIAIAVFAVVALMARRPDNAPLRMTIVSGVVAAALQLRVQSPTAQHFYLILPMIAAPIAACGLTLRLRDAAIGFALLAAGAFSPIGTLAAPWRLFVVDRLAPRPRSDLAELSRLRSWIDANATPERRYCALGSSPVFSGVLLDALWQLDPVRPPIFDEGKKPNVVLAQVDGRDGPPGPELAQCAYLLVASPVQTGLDPQFMRSVALPAAEALAGQGVGARYRRAEEAFSLENGVTIEVFERVAPVTDEDIAALASRWRAAPRDEAARRAVERFF